MRARSVLLICARVRHRCQEVVRKHFEVPACATCLVTVRFRTRSGRLCRHGENCVFADENDILEKLDFLFGKADELKRITQAGYRLVHSQHTMACRSQIFQWFTLNRQLRPDQKIIQKRVHSTN